METLRAITAVVNSLCAPMRDSGLILDLDMLGIVWVDSGEILE